MDLYHFLSLLGMTLVTILARAFFLFTNDNFKLPLWLDRALVFAPIAALSAIIAPEVFVIEGSLISSLWNSKLIACCSCLFYFYLKRSNPPSVLEIILLGLAVYLPLHLYFNI